MAQSPDLSAAELVLDGDLRELSRLANTTSRFCRENGLDRETAYDLNLALEELFVNAVKHGGCDGVRDAVQIQLQRSGDAVTVEFADRGKAFDPASVPAPDTTAPLAERAAGGLGLHLARQAIRDFEYQRVGEWNRIRMRRTMGGGS